LPISIANFVNKLIVDMT